MTRTKLLIFIYIISQEIYSQNPVITRIYTADPSARVFNDTLYIYPSHDRDSARTYNLNFVFFPFDPTYMPVAAYTRAVPPQPGVNSNTTVPNSGNPWFSRPVTFISAIPSRGFNKHAGDISTPTIACCVISADDPFSLINCPPPVIV